MPMTEKETQNPAEFDLQALEVRVEELIRACSYLKDENKSLRMRQDNLVAERAALIEKTELARTRVEAMITRLKSMEAPQ
ncbi:MAG: TIGR02449 family protein [Candidatus Thiodiazotropha sp. L084R]